MFRGLNHAITGLVAASALAGCAAHHSLPPPAYWERSAANTTVVKIVFDQNGDLYPGEGDGLDLPPPPPNRNSGFTLAEHYKGKNYDSPRLIGQAAARIVSAMQNHRSQRIVFLIKGFNNSYQSSDDEFAFVRQRIHDYDPQQNLFFVQVYWDSLYRGPGTAPAPLAYFADSLSYSNFAGMCGLRTLLAALPDGTDVTFLTHSRGAAVALGAVNDPEFDPHIEKPCNPPPLPRGKLGDAALVAFAPAVGDGHVRRGPGDPIRKIYDHIEAFYVGFAARDEATSKSFLGLRIGGFRGGDTRLGSEDGYFTDVAESLGGGLQREIFHQKEHDWEAYMSQDLQTRCLLWAGRMIGVRPERCSVTR